MVLGVVHNFQHFHEHTNLTLKGGVKSNVHYLLDIENTALYMLIDCIVGYELYLFILNTNLCTYCTSYLFTK